MKVILSLKFDICGNLGSAFYDMGEYSRAIQIHEASLEIRKKSLPDNHPAIVISYNNLDSACCALGETRKALEYYEEFGNL